MAGEGGLPKLALIVTSDSVYSGRRRDEITPLVAEIVRGFFEFVGSRVVPNRVEEIRAAVLEYSRIADVILVTGGTGLSPRDVSIEALESIASKSVPGLGEEHRRRSYGKVGARALMSRSGGFVVGRALVFASPGNPDAVSIALEILAETVEHCLEDIRGLGHVKHLR
ncbi:MAG: molybdopterin-binding protein [Thermoprotei archaeon]|nr:molybdopterin-binding protein [Thermoprotei archaeon]